MDFPFVQFAPILNHLWDNGGEKVACDLQIFNLCFGVQFSTTFVRFIYFVLMIEQSFTPGNVYIRFALFSFRWVLQARVLMSSR